MVWGFAVGGAAWRTWATEVQRKPWNALNPVLSLSFLIPGRILLPIKAWRFWFAHVLTRYNRRVLFIRGFAFPSSPFAARSNLCPNLRVAFP